MKDRSIRPAADNRRVAPRYRAAAAIDGFDGGLHLVFDHTRPRRPHAGHLRLARDVEAPDEQLPFICRLDGAQLDNGRRRVDDLESKEPLANTAVAIAAPAWRGGSTRP